ncbi:hypothetical protein QE152_g27230 [Popillia japonica]|uniref:Uncharacterized protein n=1 Tax=Popillia japonica TaxID=7064 RepID=A0AAW1JW53_POPJA
MLGYVHSGATKRETSYETRVATQTITLNQRDDHLMMTSVRPECRVMLRRCLAIVVRKEGCQGDPGDFWMYESGYLLFQDDHLMMTSVRPECRVMLRRCLAIVVRKEGCQGDPGDFWMYESGYLLFQSHICLHGLQFIPIINQPVKQPQKAEIYTNLSRNISIPSGFSL